MRSASAQRQRRDFRHTLFERFLDGGKFLKRRIRAGTRDGFRFDEPAAAAEQEHLRQEAGAKIGLSEHAERHGWIAGHADFDGGRDRLEQLELRIHHRVNMCGHADSQILALSQHLVFQRLHA